MVKIKKMVDSICVGWAACVAIGLSTSNILPVLLCLIFGILYYKQESQSNRIEKNISAVISMLFSLAMVLANLEKVLGFDGFIGCILSLLFCFNGFFAVFNLVVQNIFLWVRNDEIVHESRIRNRKNGRYLYILSFVVIFLIWGFGLLVSYPGNTTRDSRWIIDQAIWLEPMSVANPPIHTLFVRIIWTIGQNLGGDPNFSLALCCLVQMIIADLIISYCIYRLYMWGIKKWICLAALAFYALMPYNVQLMHTLWKDIPFAFLVLLFMILLWEVYEFSIRGEKISVLKYMALLITGVLMCLMRNNGYYAYLLFIPFGVYLFWKNRKSVLLVLFGILLLNKIIQGPVYDKIIGWNETYRQGIQQEITDVSNEEEAFEAENNGPSNQVVVEMGDNGLKTKVVTEMTESVTQEEPVTGTVENVPQTEVVVENATSSNNSIGIYIITIQQLARVVADRTNLSVEEIEEISQVFDINTMVTEYEPHCSDNALHLVNRSLPVTDYLKIWIKYGVKYPYSYIVAWRDATYGYWYPDIQHWIYTDQIKENTIGVYKQPLVPDSIRESVLQIEESYTRVPLYGMLWSIGFVVWLTLLGSGICIVKKGIKYALLYMPLWGIWGTLLIASPVYAEFRYMYSFFLCLPLALLMPFAKRNE